MRDHLSEMVAFCRLFGKLSRHCFLLFLCQLYFLFTGGFTLLLQLLTTHTHGTLVNLINGTVLLGRIITRSTLTKNHHYASFLFLSQQQRL